MRKYNRLHNGQTDSYIAPRPRGFKKETQYQHIMLSMGFSALRL
jgi:hypothetical protein